jgi:SAM-dependent methyltransferase
VRLLNIGCGEGTVLEDRLREELGAKGTAVIVDRVDTVAGAIEHPLAGRSWRCGIENLDAQADPPPAGGYRAAFGNFVFEHVADLPAAAAQIRRILRPGGVLIASVPNPSATAFRLARSCPRALRSVLRRRPSHPLVYAYAGLDELSGLFAAEGFEELRRAHFGAVEEYLRAWHLGPLGRLWDGLVRRCCGQKALGHACLMWRKV